MVDRRGNRDLGGDRRSVTAGVRPQCAADLFDPLAHRGDADAGYPRPGRAAPVLNPDPQHRAVRDAERGRSLGDSRVAGRVALA